MTPQNESFVTCDSVRELAVWRVSGDLGNEEHRLVDEHLRQCDSCGDFFRFASSIKERMDEVAAHPAVEMLVRYAEDPAAVDAERAGPLEEHLLLCRACMEELEILQAVQKDEVPTNVLPHEAGQEARPASSAYRPPQGFWHVLIRTLLHPAPAAGYLAAALTLTGLLLFRPERETEHAPHGVGPMGGPAVPSVIGPVVRLADERYEVRDGAHRPRDVQTVDGSRPQFLLLEFADLEQPPEAEATYKVSITAKGAGTPAWVATVKGAEFRENYTLCLSLQPGTLQPGEYLLATTDSAGIVILQGALEVR
jgi:hypothetical protein